MTTRARRKVFVFAGMQARRAGLKCPAPSTQTPNPVPSDSLAHLRRLDALVVRGIAWALGAGLVHVLCVRGVPRRVEAWRSSGLIIFQFPTFYVSVSLARAPLPPFRHLGLHGNGAQTLFPITLTPINALLSAPSPSAEARTSARSLSSATSTRTKRETKENRTDSRTQVWTLRTPQMQAI